MQTITANPTIEIQQPPKRRPLRVIGRGLKWLGIGILALILGGVVYQEVATQFDKRGYLPPGQMYTVNGRQMHMQCMSEGSPTVILEAGAFSFSLEWYWVQRQIAPTNRVCAYDRAGNGWSEPASGSRDGLTLVQELHMLLDVADIPGPYVLAGHSLGGVLNRIYAHQYPDEVLGLVLVDSGLPIVVDSYGDFEQWKSDNEILYAILYGLIRTGLGRMIIGGELQTFGYPPEIVAQFGALKSTIQAVETQDAEVRQAQWELGQQSKAAENLGDLPMIVFWADYSKMLAGFSEADRVLLQARWDAVGQMSSNSVTHVIAGSTHGSIIGDEMFAQQISDAILAVMRISQSEM